jgi:putative glycosyltransferase
MHDSSFASLAHGAGPRDRVSPVGRSDASAASQTAATSWPRLTIVTSLYKSAQYIKEFHARHVACLAPLGVDFDFVFVNDGSPDVSEAIVKELIASCPAITLISLSRNCGQHAAMLAGLTHATGDYVCALDCDLEEAPENITGMLEILRANPEIDVVYGVVDRRSAGPVRDVLSAAFYKILNLLSNLELPPNQAWQRVMSRRYVDALLRFQEAKSLYAGLMQLAGFLQQPYPIRKKYKGTTAYSFWKRLFLAIDSIVAFTSAPLLVISCIGIAVTTISFVCLMILIGSWLLGREFQSGWPSVIVSIWFMGGLILLSVGVVGIYLARVFDQVKNRPQYIVKAITRSQSAGSSRNHG